VTAPTWIRTGPSIDSGHAPRRAVDPGQRLLAPGRRGVRRDGRRRRLDPRRRDGRPLRPADHDRPDRGGRESAARRRCRSTST
jgi:hypothetical protein